MDFAVDVLSKVTDSHSIENHLIDRIISYTRQNGYRYIGAGIAKSLSKMCPNLASRLWTDLDIVPIALGNEGSPVGVDVDEVADSMVRKCVL